MGIIKDIREDLDHGALQLIAEYRQRLQVYALKLCGNAASAEDLVICTFEKAIRQIDSCREERNLFAWMKAIMENLFRNEKIRIVNRNTVVTEEAVLEQLAGADDEALERIIQRSDNEVLRAALNRLEPDFKKALVMHYFSEMPVKNIALALNLPLGTVLWRLSVARKMLAKDLGQKLGKKPLAVLGAILFGASALFGAYQTGLIDAVKSVVAGEGGEVETPPQNEEPISNDQQGTATQPTPITTQEKPNMKLTKTLAAAALAVTAAVITVEADGVTLQLDQAKQRYPWNGLVDIDYTIAYDNGATLGVDDNLEILLVNHDVTPAVTNQAISFLQAPLPLTEGSHRVTWDANADDVTNFVNDAEFIVKIRHYSEAYMVIDVSGGSATNCYPVDFLNGAPPNGFNTPEYKGNKIVLRRIHPGSYMAGSPTDEANRVQNTEKQHRVAITRPFYVGLFEVTQQQYENVMGSNPSAYQDGDNAQYRPVENVTWNKIRGGTWPNGAPASDSFMNQLIQKCKSKDSSSGEYSVKVEGFDLPTEFQWEYACRAGTTGAFNTTNEIVNTTAGQKAALDELGRNVDNQSIGQGGFSTDHTVVGSYLPNSWGLYDMHGNVYEWCLDLYVADPTTLNPKQYKDPVGASYGSTRVFRGGHYGYNAPYCRSGYRNDYGQTIGYAQGGFRLFRNLP